MTSQEVEVGGEQMENDLETPLVEKEVPEQAFSEGKRRERFETLDVFRGFIMVLMAWDHSKDMFVDVSQKGAELWQGEGPDFRNSFWFFFARAVSDLCAPGFYFTMGISIVLFTHSRLRKNMSFNYIIRHFTQRSVVLFLVGRFANFCFCLGKLIAIFNGQKVESDMLHATFSMEDPWKVAEMWFLGTFEVMTGLSLTLFVSSLFFLPYLFWLKNRKQLGSMTILKICWAFFFLFILASDLTIVHFQYDDPSNSTGAVPDDFPAANQKADSITKLFLRLLIFPGRFTSASRITYPLIPWISLTVLGMGFGFVLIDGKSRFAQLILMFRKIGLLFLASFFLVRVGFGKFGNLRGWPREDGRKDDVDKVSGLIEFFWTSKYPPSLAYILLTMGINFVALWFLGSNYFQGLGSKKYLGIFNRVLLKFGRVPLFFYAMHLLLISSACVMIGVLGDGFSGGHGQGIRAKYIWENLFLWIPLIAVLYPMCYKYDRFKTKQSVDSWWRML